MGFASRLHTGATQGTASRCSLCRGQDYVETRGLRLDARVNSLTPRMAQRWTRQGWQSGGDPTGREDQLSALTSNHLSTDSYNLPFATTEHSLVPAGGWGLSIPGNFEAQGRKNSCPDACGWHRGSSHPCFPTSSGLPQRRPFPSINSWMWCPELQAPVGTYPPARSRTHLAAPRCPHAGRQRRGDQKPCDLGCAGKPADHLPLHLPSATDRPRGLAPSCPGRAAPEHGPGAVGWRRCRLCPRAVVGKSRTTGS